MENILDTHNFSKKYLKKILEAPEVKNFSSKNFYEHFEKLKNFEFTKSFVSKNAETFFSKSLKKFSRGGMTLIFSFRHAFNFILWVSKKSRAYIKLNKIYSKKTNPPHEHLQCIFNALWRSLTRPSRGSCHNNVETLAFGTLF